jgi:hypothetical protein
MGIILTVMATGYVHQRVELVKNGYDLQEKREYLSRLVDQNSKLMYNLLKLESPRNLLASMDNEKIEFACYRAKQDNDRSYRINRTDFGEKRTALSFIGRFLDFFAVNAEASPRR